jgi:hypothetical protein
MRNPNKAVAQPRLRYDKVAIRLVNQVRDAVCESVPDGRAVIFTVTAPIRQPSKTACALAERIRETLASLPAHPEVAEVIHGNHVRIWIVAGKKLTSNVIGLVHNPGANAKELLASALSQ